MENIYVFRVTKHTGDWNFELIRQDIVLLTCVQDIERYRFWLRKQYDIEWMVEITVSNLEDNLEPYDEVQQRLLSVM